MFIRRLTLALALVSSFALVACSDEDPADNDDVGTDTDLPEIDTGEDTDVDEDTDTGEDTDVDEDTDEDTDTTPDPCAVECDEGNLAVSYIGQCFDGTTGAEIPDGGCATLTPYDAEYDANLDDVLAALPANPDNDGVVSADLSANPIDVVEATVVATNFVSAGNPLGARRTFWVADANAWIQVYLDEDEADVELSDIPIRVGQTVSFTVTEITNYFGTPEVTRIAEPESGTNVTLTCEEQFVYAEHITDRELTSADINKMIALEGEITEVVPMTVPGCLNDGGTEDNDSDDTSQCVILSYGSGEEIILSTRSPQAVVGADVDWFGPVGARDGQPRLTDQFNFSWGRYFAPN